MIVVATLTSAFVTDASSYTAPKPTGARGRRGPRKARRERARRALTRVRGSAAARFLRGRTGAARPLAAGRRRAPYNPRMRRRLRSAAFPLHRHSLPQLAVDAALVALAYYLAFWLRFEDQARGLPERYHRLLIVTWPWVVLGTVLLLAASRVYQRRWRYVSQRDIELLVRALVVATVLLVAVVAIVHPVLWGVRPAPHA